MSYFDTSVVYSFYVPDENSAAAQAAYERETAPVTISDWVEVEYASALSRRVRQAQLSLDDARRAWERFETHRRKGLYELCGVNATHFLNARRHLLDFELPLKSPDALHIGIVQRERYHLVTADKQLADNALALGLEATYLGATR